MAKSGSARLEAASGKSCPYCNNRLARQHHKRGDAPTRDHIYPQSRGGRLIVICCRKCNADKGDMTLSEWATVLVARHDFRAKTVSALAADLINGKRCVLPGHVIAVSLMDFAIGIADGVFA